ncbi:actin family protein, partial [Reticulomyxa filosa]
MWTKSSSTRLDNWKKMNGKMIFLHIHRKEGNCANINEKVYCVALNDDDELKKADTSGDLEQKYEFPDGQVITVEHAGDLMCIDDAAVDHNPPKQAIKFTDLVFVENYP